MVTQTATIHNMRGIHCRPSAIILKQVEGYSGEITISAETGTVKLWSIIELLCLALEHGMEVEIMVSGEDEKSMCTKLVSLFETTYDFPPMDAEDQ